MKILKNARIFSHYINQGITRSDHCEIVDIAYEGDRIFEIGKDLNYPRAQVTELNERLVLPGFFDPQVHFREPGGEHKETLHSGAMAAARGGFTAVVTMPNTIPTTDCAKVLEQILEESKRIGLVKIYPTASVTKDLKGLALTDFAALKKAGAVALTDDGKGIQSNEIMLEAMKRARLCRLPILDHAEDDKLSNGGAIHAGMTAKKYGTPAIVGESESEHVRRGCEMALVTGARYHVLHVSSAESLKWIKKYKARGANVTVEVSPHHLLLSDEDIHERADGTLDSNFKMNPPIRSPYDREKINEAFLMGEIDAIATDHAPHTTDEKSLPIEKAPFGIVGVETAFPLIYTNYYLTNKLPLYKIVDLMTIKAAHLFELDLGQIKVGGASDLVVIDEELEELIDPNTFLSKGRNTPFIGHKVKGIPVLTICAGNTSFQHKYF